MSAATPNREPSGDIAQVDCRDVASILGLGNRSSGFHCPACQGRDQSAGPRLEVSPDEISCANCGFEGDAVELVGEARGCAPDVARDWLRNEFANFASNDIDVESEEDAHGSAIARELAAELGLELDDDDEKSANLADELDFDDGFESESEDSVDLLDEIRDELDTGITMAIDHPTDETTAMVDDDGLGSGSRKRPAAPVALGTRGVEATSSPTRGDESSDRLDDDDDEDSYDLAEDSRTGVVDSTELQKIADEVGNLEGFDLAADPDVVSGATLPVDEDQANGLVDINTLVDLPENQRSELMRNNILVEFLSECPEPSERLRKWLQTSGIISDVVHHLHLRSLPRNYLDMHHELVGKYGNKSLLDAGLSVLRRGPRGKPIAQPAFRSFYNSKVRLLLIPFARKDEPLFINALPMAPPKELREKNLRPRRTTDASEPAMLNEDVLDVAEKVLICRGEFLTMIAMSMGFDAVGVSGWSHFRPNWISRFEGKKVMLVGPNNDSAGASIETFNKMFDDAGLNKPDVLLYEPGGNLVQFLRSQIPGSWVVDRLGNV